MIQLSNGHLATRKLETLVENRTIYNLNNAELNVFETHQQAERVYLQLPDPMLASMITGKKIMHLHGLPDFDFFPGESVILPANEPMIIDFPEATCDTPTKCLALTFAPEKLRATIQTLNEQKPRSEGEWGMADYNLHFTNEKAINQILQRLIFIFTENHPSKDLFADLLMQELLIRILQTEAKSTHQQNAKTDSNKNRMAYVLRYIQDNLSEPISVEQLSKKAYMSVSSFYREFKNEMGSSPNDYIIDERIKLAEKLLKQPNVSIKEACLQSGFNSFSYFSRIFKKRKNFSPSKYKERLFRSGK
jgi:AraC family transcriptional regulator